MNGGEFASAMIEMDNLPYGLVIAMVTGLFGASFFMLIELHGKLGRGDTADLREMWTPWFLMLRCIVGVGAAAILYFFFRSGLLEGSLWPKLGSLGFEQVERSGSKWWLNEGTRTVPNRDFALLIVWSFLAGYSQTLVPGLLLKTEGKASAQP
jgi:hypothetical protein